MKACSKKQALMILIFKKSCNAYWYSYHALQLLHYKLCIFLFRNSFQLSDNFFYFRIFTIKYCIHSECRSRNKQNDICQNILRFSFEQKMVPKSSENNKKKLNCFNICPAFLEQTVNSYHKKNIQNLHIQIEIQLKELSQTSVIHSVAY